ncbi:TBC1 domain family member 9B-like, partial [Etheostoma cragini]|uniref:TBC1 domain family member 9B-like n=1 Tax=Etheostoma cragini TaxID=417921 RepID=UPI00155E12D3
LLSAGLLVGTLDVVLDSSARVAPYRILLQTADSQVFWSVACGSSRKEITEHWDWLESNLLQTVSIFDNDEDVTTFVKGKILGIIAEEKRLQQGEEPEEDCGKFREAELKMRRLFLMPEEEKLVNYYSCSFWKGRVPRQGWLYLSINHLCFYSFLLGKEVTLVVQWSEVTRLEKNATLVFPESVRVSTRHSEHFFSMFININDTFRLMEQLANIAMRQLLDNEAFAADRSLPKACKTLRNVSTLKRDLDARAKNERYRAMFRLTQDERLDGHTDCTLWTPFAKMHVVGQLFISNNYVCFSSREEDLCQLIIPLREVPIDKERVGPLGHPQRPGQQHLLRVDPHPCPLPAHPSPGNLREMRAFPVRSLRTLRRQKGAFATGDECLHTGRGDRCYRVAPSNSGKNTELMLLFLSPTDPDPDPDQDPEPDPDPDQSED